MMACTEVKELLSNGREIYVLYEVMSYSLLLKWY